ncbi:MAG: SLBB domain-containing protein [Candidatus Eisenbacteria bacterium]|nr:SLBB domain-containing protein [Candidatus Eisenbacteria bacterium]
MDSNTVRAIEKAGVVGAGGGAFPTHAKAAARADTVLANGAECEPLVLSDSFVMTTAAERVVRGLELMAEAVGAGRAVVAVKAENAEAAGAMAKAIGRRPIELLELENVYPAGDELLLVHAATDRVVPEGGHPTDIGVVVSNVTTLAQVADAAEGRPVTERPVTVRGEVRRPGVYVVPIGTPVADVLAAAGPIGSGLAVLAGGPMMGRLAADDEVTDRALSGLFVLPRSHRLIATRTATESHVLRMARAACCQCLACTELCPRALLGHALAPHRTVRAVQYDTAASDAAGVTSAFLCSECGMCELFACPLELQPRRILADLKAELRRRGVQNPHRRSDLRADGVRAWRQIPSERLRRRLGLSDYCATPAVSGERVRPGSVRLRLDRHAGAPAVPVVTEGSRVLAGDVVAEIPEGALGARVHASVSGRVASVSREEVEVAAE